METTKYYTIQEQISRQFGQTARRCGFRATTPMDFWAWKAHTRSRLKELLGFSHFRPAPLCPVLGPREEGDGFYRQHLRLQVEPGIYQTSYLLIPKDAPSGPLPTVIAAHGHGSGGKMAIAGLDGDSEELRAKIREHNYTYGVEFAKRGFLVACPDSRGFGQRRERSRQGDDPADFIYSTCREINQMALPLGQCLTGMQAWDLMRLVDYLQTREDCDGEKIACVGLSGGGAQTLWLSALDDRIKGAVVSGYFYGYHDALLLLNENCSCNYVPHLWEEVDMGDLAALIAPRPLLIESGDQDPLNGPRGVVNCTEQVQITRKAYDLLGKPGNLVHHIFSGGHRWCGEKAYDFIKKALG